MKKIDIGQLSGILANLGVLVGIFFLAVELDQNRQIFSQQLALDRLTGRDAALETFNGFRNQLLDNPYLIPVWNKGISGEPLGAEESEQFELLCANYVWSQVALYARFAALELPREVAATAAGIRRMSRFDRVGQCWQGTKAMISMRGYGALVEMVEGAPDDD